MSLSEDHLFRHFVWVTKIIIPRNLDHYLDLPIADLNYVKNSCIILRTKSLSLKSFIHFKLCDQTDMCFLSPRTIFYKHNKETESKVSLWNIITL